MNIFFILNFIHVGFSAYINKATPSKSKEVLINGSTKQFNIYTSNKNYNSMLFPTKIDITYKGIKRYYKITESYIFATPEVSTKCHCECPTKNIFECEPNSNHKFPPCPSYHMNTSRCFHYFNEGKLPGCKFGHRMCCQVFVTASHKYNKKYRAINIDNPFDIVSLKIKLKTLDQGDAQNFNLDIPTSIEKYGILIDFNIVIKISQIENEQSLSQSFNDIPTYYYIDIERNRVLNNDEVNSLEEMNLQKLGWFRYNSYDKIEHINKYIFNDALKITPITCSENPQYSWELKATNYYQDGKLISPPSGISLLEDLTYNIKNISIDDRNKIASFSLTYSSNIVINICDNPNERFISHFFAFLTKNNENQHVLTIVFSEDFTGFSGTILITDTKTKIKFKERINNNIFKTVVNHFSHPSWICLLPKAHESKGLCRPAELLESTPYEIKFINKNTNRNEDSIRERNNITKTNQTTSTIWEFASVAKAKLFPTIVTCIILALLFSFSGIVNVLQYMYLKLIKRKYSSKLNYSQLDNKEHSSNEVEEETLITRDDQNFSDFNFSENIAGNLWDDFKTLLRSKYLHLHLPLYSWFLEMEVNFKDSFINPTLQVCSNFNQRRSGQEIQSLEFFSNFANFRSNKMVIIGGDGAGKTALACKLARDWAEGKDYIANVFDAVVLISLNKFQCTIVEAIKNEINRDCSAILKQKQDKILLILDGYDQLSLDRKKCILPILYKADYPQLTVIVTSRFENNLINDDFLPFINYRRVPWDKWIFIKSFDAKQKIQFLQRYSLNTYDKFQTNVNNFMKNPFYLLLIATGIIPESELINIKSKTDLYLSFFKFMIKKCLLKSGILIEKFDLLNRFENISPSAYNSYLSLMKLFGKFQIKNIEKRNYIYKKLDILDAFDGDDKILSFGILRKIIIPDNKTSDETYEPSHITFAQFCAAYYLWRLYDEDENLFNAEISNMIERNLKPVSSSLIYPCVAGLLGQNAFKLFQILTEVLSTNDYRVCTFDEHGNHKFLPIINMLNECEIKESILISLKAFLPYHWEILQENDFFSSQLHADLLQYGTKSNCVKHLHWHTKVAAFIPEKLSLNTLKIKTDRVAKTLFDSLQTSHTKKFELEIIHHDTEKIDDIVKLIDCIGCEQIVIRLPRQYVNFTQDFLKKCFPGKSFRIFPTSKISITKVNLAKNPV